MQNSYSVLALSGGNVQKVATAPTTVEAYAWQSGTPFYDSGDKIGDLVDSGDGVNFTIEVANTVKATILIDSIVVSSKTGFVLWGNNIPTLDF